MAENTSDVTITLTLNEDYLCAACSCGVSMLIPMQRAVLNEQISCDCGTAVKVDSTTVEQLRVAEKTRLRSQAIRP